MQPPADGKLISGRTISATEFGLTARPTGSKPDSALGPDGLTACQSSQAAGPRVCHRPIGPVKRQRLACSALPITGKQLPSTPALFSQNVWPPAVSAARCPSGDHPPSYSRRAMAVNKQLPLEVKLPPDELLRLAAALPAMSGLECSMLKSLSRSPCRSSSCQSAARSRTSRQVLVVRPIFERAQCSVQLY